MFISFVQNAALLITLSVFFGVLNWYRPKNDIFFRISSGIWFGLIAIAAMLLPFEYQQGTFYDGRSVILTLAGLFGGGVTTLVSVAVAGGFRFYLGGTGIWAGMATILFCGLIGLAFRRLYKSRTDEIHLYVLFLVGYVAHIVMLACQFLLPSQVALEVLKQIWLPVLLIFPLTFALIAKLIQLIDHYIQSSKRIREAEALYRTTLLSIGDAVIITDIKGAIIRMNSVAEHLTGWPFPEAKGKMLSKVFRIINEETGADEPNPAEIVLQEDRVIGLSRHTILLSKEGDRIPVADSAAPVKDETGEVTGVVLVFRDQTEEREHQRSLTQSEERFSKSILLAPFPIMLYDENGNVIHLSEGWTNYSGYTLEDIPTIWEWAKRAYGEKAQEVVAYNLAIIDKEVTDESGEYEIVTKSGERRVWDFFTTPLGKLSGGKRVMLNIASDITDRKNSDRALIKSEENYRKLFEDHSAAKFLIRPADGKIVKANSAAAHYYGWTVAQLESMTIDQINTLSLNEVKEQMSKARNKKADFFEFKHRRADGSVRDVEVFSSKVIYGGEELLHSIIHDITDKKRLFGELVAAKEKAEESERLKSAFLANMSHEIRTPLNGILGFTNLLTEDNGLTEDQKQEYASIIKKSAEGLMKIINDVLEISRLETGKELIEKEPFELCKMLRTIYGFYTKKIEDSEIKGVELKLVCPDTRIILNSDELRLTQVFSNLLDNALKFTSSGTVEFGVSMIEKGRLELFVSDTGIGVPKDKQQVIFERFSQADVNTSRNYGGTGLGLAIVKRLVELMGGEIRLESEPGKGSKFTVSFPVDNSFVSVTENTVKEKRETSMALGHILVVEDDKVSRLLMNHMLKGKSSELAFVTTGKEAIEYINSKHPEIVLMDIGLPDANGLDIVRSIRQYNQKVYIIAQTAFAMADDEREALKAGCNDYMSKPVREEILSKKLLLAMEG